MNFLGHTFVALATGDEDALFLLGAALPDLVSMAGVRLDRSRRHDGPLGRGVRCHTATDAAFHTHSRFRQGSAAIGADLVGAGLRRGPARAIGHAGWELLADGTLLGSPVEAAFRRALATGDQASGSIVAADRARWARFLVRWDQAPADALRYDDPGWVADRLHAMLSGRRLLSFPDDELPTVRRVLADHAPGIAGAAGQVLADVTEMMDCPA